MEENKIVEEKDIEVNVIQNPSKGFLGLIGAKEGIYEITVIKKEEIEIAKEFVESMLLKSKINAKVNATQEGNLIKISIEGKEAACLIGRRGETLDAVQFLTGLALNKINKDSHMRVIVDIENYRSKVIKANKKQQIGNFTILPFDVVHDAEEPLGFLIKHQDIGTLLFITDTCYVNITSGT